MTGLRDNDAYANLNLDNLPSKVAEVQTELQQLEEATRQYTQKVRQAELANQQNHDSQQLLQQQLQQDLAMVHTLQMQQADLLALNRAQAQHPKKIDKQAVLQVSLLAIWILQIVINQESLYRTSTKQPGCSSSMLPFPLKPFATFSKNAFNQRKWTVHQQLQQMRLQSYILRVRQHIGTTVSSSNSHKKLRSYLSMASKASVACIQL